MDDGWMDGYIDGWMDGGVICGGDMDQIMETVVRGVRGEGQVGGGKHHDQVFCGS